MNPTFARALVLAVPLTAWLGISLWRLTQRRTRSAPFQVLAAACFLVVVLVHIAEGLQIWPGMGWGQPHSVGHYLDLTSAIVGVTCLAFALAMRLL